MKFYTENQVRLKVTKTKKPKFSTHGGRTWDFGHILIDGEKYEAHLDTTWGQYIYFQYGDANQWYKVKMYSDNIEDLKGNRYDIDPFSHDPHKITTK